jgi:hypothetical protein
VEEVDQWLRWDGYTNFYGDKKGHQNSIFIVYTSWIQIQNFENLGKFEIKISKKLEEKWWI